MSVRMRGPAEAERGEVEAGRRAQGERPSGCCHEDGRKRRGAVD